MNYDRVAFLEITSFSGISTTSAPIVIAVAAEHYYGKIIIPKPYEHVSLTRKLSKRQAIELNKKDGCTHYCEGRETERFDSKDEIIELAISSYKAIMPNAKALVLGRISVCDPKLVLDAPKGIMERCNKIYLAYKKIPWIEKYGFSYLSPENEARVEEMTRRWESVLYGDTKNRR